MPILRTLPAAISIALSVFGLTLIATTPLGCSGIEKAPPRPHASRAARSFDLEVPRMMRGTIASETIVLGYQPVIARGWGLVVGLNGSGSRNIPPALRAHMISEMARRGLGRESSGYGHLQPQAMLDSMDTAVVVVEGVIPPGAVGRQSRRGLRIDGTQFDVRVYADPRSGTTSLEGGRLYTTPLAPVQSGQPLPPVGAQPSAAPIAEAGGPILVNPFANAADLATAEVSPTVGRILNGGEVTRDMPIKLRLATPSHARAGVIQSAVNTLFPQEPGQRDPTARGESSESIRITVPTSWRKEPGDFVELLRHSTIRQTGAEAIANSIKRVVLADPASSFDAAWRWEALGVRALPILQTLYDIPEEMPRLAALRAGTRLEDALVIPHLIDMAESPSPDVRIQAISLLADVRYDPRVDRVLQTRLSDPDIDVRLAAYESEIKRSDPVIERMNVGGKFILDVIESDFPMIYITQIGQPRIAVFARDIELKRPLRVDAWGGRLLLKSRIDEEEIEVYHRPEDGRRAEIHPAPSRVAEFVQFLAHKPTPEHPEPGLGLNYGQTVSALFQIWRQKQIPADFKAEQDRVLAAILRQRRGREVQLRPEFSDPDFDFLDAEKAPAPVDQPTAANLSR